MCVCLSVCLSVYLHKYVRTCICIYYLVCLGWIIIIIISIEFLISWTCSPFTQNTAAQFLYFFKSLYFIVSSFQIIAGYPPRVLGYFLSRKYSTLSGILFMGYRAIPLLPELREVMDWVFTDTALALFHWFRVQEVYAKLYLVKVRREREKVKWWVQDVFGVCGS